MADVSTYLVLGLVIVPPILRQAQRLVSSARAKGPNDPSSPPRPKFLSRARLTPFATPFSSAISITTLLLVFISLRNLIPVQYGLDIFIPSSTVEGLRKTLYTLYTAPSLYRPAYDSEEAAFHIEAFRGGHKPDLFLAYKAPITIPTTTLRNLINDTPSLLPIGRRTSARLAELQALIARLSSYEGRRMYLLLGPGPLLDCTFCKTANDYFWYAVPFLFGAYAWRILAIGLLTTHPDDPVAVAIRQAASLFGFSSHATSQRHTQGLQVTFAKKHEADRSGWRSSALTVLLGLLLVELLVMFEFGQVTADSSRLNHWHSNLHLLRQVVFLALVLVVYLFPSSTIIGSFDQTMMQLETTQQSLQSLMHVSDLADISRTVVLEDDQLLDISQQWKRNHNDKTEAAIGSDEASRIIQVAMARGGQAASEAIAQAQAGIRRVTHGWWQSAQQFNQQLDQRERLFEDNILAQSGGQSASSSTTSLRVKEEQGST